MHILKLTSLGSYTIVITHDPDLTMHGVYGLTLVIFVLCRRLSMYPRQYQYLNTRMTKFEHKVMGIWGLEYVWLVDI